MFIIVFDINRVDYLKLTLYMGFRIRMFRIKGYVGYAQL